MQRKIKFRVWDNLKKEWVSNKNIWRMKTDPNGIGEIEPNAFYWKQHPQGLTIQQYTGLKDKNGVEIWEGDVLKIRNHNRLQQVIFQDGCFGVDLENMIDGREFIPISNDYYPHDLEIVGNIFENSELLK